MRHPLSDSAAQRLHTFFRSNTYTAIRVIAGVITLLVLLGYPYIPAKTVTLLPNPSYPYFQYAGDKEAQPASNSEAKISCAFNPTSVYSCGISLSIAPNERDGLNLEDFDGLLIHSIYTGASNRFRITMRNYNPVYASTDPVAQSKNQLTFIRSSDFNKPAFIKLSEFSVAEWWIRQFDIPREQAAPEFTNIISIGLDFVDFGQQALEIKKIELVGAWIPKDALYLSILLLWMCLIIGEGIIRFVLIYIDSKSANKKIHEMTESYRQLEVEKTEFEVLSATDALTGILNRAGVNNAVSKFLQNEDEKNQLGIMLFDIDHFKKINDTYGHDVGDLVLKTLSKVIADKIRKIDVFGRWGGEEFIIIAPQISAENVVNLAEKLRMAIETHMFEPTLSLRITVSVGVAIIKPHESFEQALKNADLALYSAKNQGRNKVVQSSGD